MPSPHTLTEPEARFLYEKAGFAAYSAFRAFELEVDNHFEDAKQEAALTFWQLYWKKGSEGYAFVGAKYAAMQSLWDKGPYNCLSLDATRDGYSSPWEERLPVTHSQHNDGDNGDWLSDADLRDVVTKMFTIPASPQALDGYKRLLRHQMAGHTLQETAMLLHKTSSAVKALRQRLTIKLAAHYGVPPTWEAVAAKLSQEEDLDGAVLAVSGTPPAARTVDYKAAILRLLLKGYDTAAIAVELGRTEQGIKCARRDLRRKLIAYCKRLGIEPPDYNRNGGGWRPAHHYAAFHSGNAGSGRS